MTIDTTATGTSRPRRTGSANWVGTLWRGKITFETPMRPAFELHYPKYAQRFRDEAHVGGKPSPYEVATQAAAHETQPIDDPRSR